MGRETKILLGLLVLLAGVFVGVLSMKLFVPRPPDGAGPDIDTDHEFVETQQVVEPPTLAPRAWDFAAAPPLVSDKAAPVPPATSPERPLAAVAPRELAPPPPAASDDLLGPAPETLAPEPRSRFAVQPAALGEDTVTPADDALLSPAPGVSLDPSIAPSTRLPAPPSTRDPFVARATLEQPAPPAALDPSASSVPANPPVAQGSRHTVQPGDSWWSLAERAYGDGRLYRALFAWNRVLDPRVALAPGTTLEVPPLPKLEAAWPKLLPPPGP